MCAHIRVIAVASKRPSAKREGVPARKTWGKRRWLRRRGPSKTGYRKEAPLGVAGAAEATTTGWDEAMPF